MVKSQNMGSLFPFVYWCKRGLSGNDDSLCHLPYLYTLLQSAEVGTGAKHQLQVWGGGHSLGIALSADKMDEVATGRNLSAFAQGVMNWAWLVGK